MFKVAICDDEPAVCAQIEELTQGYGKDAGQEIETEAFYSGAELVRKLQQGEVFDLLFLDIEMEGINGVAVGRLIREELKDWLVQIVYISGKTEYALELFQVHPFDFLVKPMDKKKLYDTLAKLISLAKVGKKFFSYKQGGEHYHVKLGEIIYFESMDRQIKMVTVKNCEGILFYGRMGDVFLQLKGCGFLEVHRSYIVNTNHIAVYRNKELIMSDKASIPVSQSKRTELRDFQLQQEMEDF